MYEYFDVLLLYLTKHFHVNFTVIRL